MYVGAYSLLSRGRSIVSVSVWFAVRLGSACSEDAGARVQLEIPCASCALCDCVHVASLRAAIRSVVRFIGEIIGVFRT